MKKPILPTGTLLLGATTLLSFLVYYPGLSGGFIFDDFGNINKLGDYNGVRNLDTFLKYIASGIAGPTGRPISLLSFLLNGTDWPTDPFPFKLTNVLLHGVSGIFLYLLCRQLLRCFYPPSPRSDAAALFAAAVWLLHPFLVSTVLYVVQRMAMLSAFFSIVGLWLYAQGRHLLATEPRRAYRYMTGAVVAFTLLALLSKENGVLLPLLIACVEWCVFRHPASPTAPLNRYWQAVFIILPSLAVFGYLYYVFNPYTLDHPFHTRTFTLPQRLMTESRIVVGYLYHLWIPRLAYPGLLNENIELSTGLMTPPTTLFSLILLSILLVGALALRNRWPLLSLSVLFFLAGHVLESTTIGLELYFEHRNYLPAIFLFLPLGTLLIRYDRQSIKAGLLLFLAVCSLFTYQHSRLWGNPLELTVFWAAQNRYSSRAQRTAALELENTGHPEAALHLLTRAKTDIPDSLDLQWHWLLLQCRFGGGVTADQWAHIEQATRTLHYDSKLFNILRATVGQMRSPDCKGVDNGTALLLLDALLTNPSIARNPRLRFQMHHLKGAVFAATKRPELALAEFDKVIKIEKNIEHGLVQVGMLASNGYFREALKHLEDIEALAIKKQPNQWLPLNVKPDYLYEIERIKRNLLEDLRQVL
ncbi:MAG: hypothetical protein Kow0065_13160 [Methylomicrobium sp.]